jgi:NAD-dependent SIR2 family protein deacetylase
VDNIYKLYEAIQSADAIIIGAGAGLSTSIS